MSNHLAVATVTATLTRLLQAAVVNAVPGAVVRAGRPDAPSGTPPTRVNTYLYQATSNAALRNTDLPTREGDGRLLQRPQLALDLHYLLSFYGVEQTLEPERLLGSVVRALHSKPVLTRQMIKDTLGDAAYNFLAGSNLDSQIELVKFTPLALSLDELSKLWSVFFQVPYALSIAYQGTVVLIESEVAAQEALPVRERGLYVVPFRQPVIERILAEGDTDQPILAESAVVLTGKRLKGELTEVRIAGIDVTPPQVTHARIGLTLPAGLAAGVLGAQVVHRMLIGSPPVPHRGVESNVAPFVLHPTVTAIQVADVQGSGDNPRSANITVQVEPVVGKSQRVVLLLNELAENRPAAYTFVAAPRDADSGSLTIPVSGVKTADYLVRIQVDGAESPLTIETDPNSPAYNQYVGPKATIP